MINDKILDAAKQTGRIFKFWYHAKVERLVLIDKYNKSNKYNKLFFGFMWNNTPIVETIIIICEFQYNPHIPSGNAPIAQM